MLLVGVVSLAVPAAVTVSSEVAGGAAAPPTPSPRRIRGVVEGEAIWVRVAPGLAFLRTIIGRVMGDQVAVVPAAVLPRFRGARPGADLRVRVGDFSLSYTSSSARSFCAPACGTLCAILRTEAVSTMAHSAHTVLARVDKGVLL
jgi:hypothetical protein